MYTAWHSWPRSAKALNTVTQCRSAPPWDSDPVTNITRAMRVGGEQHTVGGPHAHRVRPQDRAQTAAVDRALQHLRQQRHPETVEPSCGDGVEPGAEAGADAIVERLGQQQQAADDGEEAQ